MMLACQEEIVGWADSTTLIPYTCISRQPHNLTHLEMKWEYMSGTDKVTQLPTHPD